MDDSTTLSFGFAPLRRAALALTLLAIPALGCDDAGSGTMMEGDGASGPLDASTDGSPQSDAGDASTDAGDTGASDEEDAGGPCHADADCNDGAFCNGQETCRQGRCVAGTAPVCPTEHACSEQQRGCDCTNPNVDGDAQRSTACGGDDCDDSRADIYKGAIEICDPAGVDEDCDPTTYYRPGFDGDNDTDKGIDVNCYNIDEHGERHGGDDCNDHSPVIYKGNSETCDYNDNDCDGFVDETLDKHGQGNHDNGGMQENFYPDTDGDGCGDMRAKPVRACGFDELVGYVRGAKPCDCDDTKPTVHEKAPETCDGLDNDCDGLLDAEDDDLYQPANVSDVAVCDADLHDWTIHQEDCPTDRLWCTDSVERGCTTDATQLESCHACHTDCNFACGKTGCDGVKTVVAGESDTCAITEQGAVACWGLGIEGRLGNGEARNSSVPVQVIGLKRAVGLAVGPNSACAVVGEKRALQCWGSNTSDQLAAPDSGAGFSALSVQATSPDGPALSDVVSVAVAKLHACAVRSTGDMICWGSQEDGRLANLETTGPPLFHVFALDQNNDRVANAAIVSLGERHGCLITKDGALECWGDNSVGQLGDPNFTDVSSPTVRPVPGLDQVSKVATGSFHTCVVRMGEVLCWGLNDRLQLGRESGDNDLVPLPVAGLSGVEDIAAGAQFTCARKSDGSVFCWGSNEAGERGDDNPNDSAVPTKIGLDHIQQITLGGLHACALSDGQTYCWGYNDFGQLGLGDLDLEGPTPRPVKALNRD